MANIHSRCIYWYRQPAYKGGPTANVLIIGKRYDKSVSGYARLVKVARETFPNIQDKDIDISQVITSKTIKGLPIISFHVNVARGDIPGYESFEINDPIDFTY